MAVVEDVYGIRFKSRKDMREYTKYLGHRKIKYRTKFDPSRPHQDEPYCVMPNMEQIDKAIDAYYTLQEEMAEARRKSEKKERKAESKEEKHEEQIERGEVGPKQTLIEREKARRATKYGPTKGTKVLKKPPEEIPAQVKEEILMPAVRYGFRDAKESFGKAKHIPDPLKGFKKAIPVSAAEREAAGHPEYKYYARIGYIGAPKITRQAAGTGEPAIAGTGRTPIAGVGRPHISEVGASSIAGVGRTSVSQVPGRANIANYRVSPSLRFASPKATKPPSVSKVTGYIGLRRPKLGQKEEW